MVVYRNKMAQIGLDREGFIPTELCATLNVLKKVSERIGFFDHEQFAVYAMLLHEIIEDIEFRSRAYVGEREYPEE